MKNISNITGGQNRKACILFLSVLVAAGIIAGAVFEVKSSSSLSCWLHQYFAPAYSGSTIMQIMANTFKSSLLFVAAAFLTGFFAFGQPLGAALLVYRGFGIGASAALMYSTEGSAALPEVAVLILPKAIAVVLISILAVRELMKASGAVLAWWISEGSRDDNRISFRLYCLKFTVLIILSFIVSAADAALNYAFSALR